MIIIEQLRVSDNGKTIYINAHINEAQTFNNVFFESVTIATADQIDEASFQDPPTEYVYKKTFPEGTRRIDLVVSPYDTEWDSSNLGDKDPCSGKDNLSSTLFFVYFKCNAGNAMLDPCLPCRLDEEITVGVTFDESVLYQRVMDYTKQLANDCTIPQGFTDFILLWNAFKSSVETEHFVPAIKYFNMLFGKGDFHLPGGTTVRRGCGCHG